MSKKPGLSLLFRRMRNPDIVLIGASVRSLAESAIRDGWLPVCVDMFGDADLVQLLSDPGAELRRINGFRHVPSVLADIPAGLPAVISGGFEYESDALFELAERFTVCGTKGDAVAAVRDPEKLFRTVEGSGCSIPAWQPPGEDAPSFTQFTHGRLRWLVKSVCSAGGTEVRSFSSLRNKHETERQQYLQEFVDGIPVSATFLQGSMFGRQTLLLGAALQLSGCESLNAPGFHFCGNAGPLRLSPALTRLIERTGRTVAQQFLLQGVFGIDFILNRDGLWILEVNPRVTASHELHEWAYPHRPSCVSLQVAASVSSPDRILPGSVCRISNDRMSAESDRSEPLSSKTALMSQNRRVGQFTERPSCRWARMVLYSKRSTLISAEESGVLLSYAQKCAEYGAPRPVFLADVPKPQTRISKGTPICSLYVNLNVLWKPALTDLLADVRIGDLQDLEKLVEQIQEDLDWCERDFEFVN